ncbi:hypothetical protein BDV35DRAFT_387324 [Aspergillus flavus]|uniref:Uncharacterized protein n=1 Tax=Aspergillus flavus TaxID=5059 RepID=A0A5N6HDM1_ASPFL|nr:hypothetical protein BDV35DRAFT_387324 [Aspergillus flavus]
MDTQVSIDDELIACAGELRIPLHDLVNHMAVHGTENFKLFRQLTPEEWSTRGVRNIVLGENRIGRYLAWREENKQGRIDVDYSGYELPGGLDADAVYNPHAIYALENAVFLPAIDDEIAYVFDARGSGWSVISLGIRAHECTLYLLLPTALVYNYRARVEQELGDKPWLELDVEDPTFHQYIEALKQWAPEGTKFVNRRIDIDGDGAEPCDRLMEVLTAMTGDLTLPPPITWTILEASYDVLGTVDMEMRKLKRWWCPRQVWVSVVPREEGNFADLYPSAPERPESERLVVEPRREEDDDSSDDSDDGSDELDDAWGFNKYHGTLRQPAPPKDEDTDSTDSEY